MAHHLPIGIYEKALPYNATWHERLAMAREAGFDFVEMSVDESDERLARLDWSASERAELREAVAATGVPIITLCLSGHRKWALGQRLALKSASAAWRSCARRSSSALIPASAPSSLPATTSTTNRTSRRSMERYRDGLAQGLEWASQAGVMLALENVDGNDVDSITKAMIFVDHFNSPWFQVYPDVGNLGEHGLDVCAELERGRGHLVGIHVKDTRPGEPRRVPFGQGIVPFVDAFRKLAEMRYVGPVMLEMWNDDSPDSLRIIRDARAWILARMVEAGLIAG